MAILVSSTNYIFFYLFGLVRYCSEWNFYASKTQSTNNSAIILIQYFSQNVSVLVISGAKYIFTKKS